MLLVGRQSRRLGGPFESEREQSDFYSNLLVESVNSYRAKREIAPLIWSDNLANIAFKWSQQLSSGELPYSHTGMPERYEKSTTALKPLTLLDYAENLAKISMPVSHESVDAAIAYWLVTDTYARNIFAEFNFSAGAITVKGKALSITLVFAKTF